MTGHSTAPISRPVIQVVTALRPERALRIGAAVTGCNPGAVGKNTAIAFRRSKDHHLHRPPIRVSPLFRFQSILLRTTRQTLSRRVPSLRISSLYLEKLHRSVLATCPYALQSTSESLESQTCAKDYACETAQIDIRYKRSYPAGYCTRFQVIVRRYGMQISAVSSRILAITLFLPK